MQEFSVSSIEEMFKIISPGDFVVDLKPGDEFPITSMDRPFFYRGQAENSEKWGLIPSFFRDIDFDKFKQLDKSDQKSHVARFCQFERNIYDGFADRSRGFLPAWVDRKNAWEMISIAQHFGVPTRLLDWSRNFLAATYFAVSDCNKFDKDGVVWCLRGKQFSIREAHPEINKERLRYMRFASLPTETSFFNSFGGDQQANNLTTDREPYFALILPPHLDNRMKNQGGIFSVHVTFKEPETFDDLAFDHAVYLEKTAPSVLMKFIIKAQAKEELKEKLEDLGIDFSYLFPDLNGLAMYLKEQRKKTFDVC